MMGQLNFRVVKWLNKGFMCVWGHACSGGSGAATTGSASVSADCDGDLGFVKDCQDSCVWSARCWRFRRLCRLKREGTFERRALPGGGVLGAVVARVAYTRHHVSQIEALGIVLA